MAEQPPIHRHLRPKRAGLERNAKGPEADTITAAQDLLPPGLTKPEDIIEETPPSDTSRQPKPAYWHRPQPQTRWQRCGKPGETTSPLCEQRRRDHHQR